VLCNWRKYGYSTIAVKRNKSPTLFKSGEHMDIHILRTFLAVADHQGLRKAAEVMHLTPSAISSRIRQLEHEIGIQLFDRDRNGVVLTPAGCRLKSHAEKLIQQWSSIRLDVLNREHDHLCLRIGASDIIWQSWLQNRLGTFMAAAPDCEFILRTGGRSELAQMLINGTLDCAVLPEMIKYPGISCQRVTEIELMLVRSSDINDSDALALPRFVDIEWGADFRNHRSLSNAITPVPSAEVNVAWLALDWLLRFGGTAWLPVTMAAPHIKQGSLHPVAGKERIPLIIYAAVNNQNDIIYSILQNILCAEPDTQGN